tara:strand:+ start:6260 stop:9547 length:3288 start_codon:yes stop_codon:yes gene_type:complete
MRSTLFFLILIYSINSYGIEIAKDSTNIKKNQILDYKKELKKFKDSISEINFPLILSKEYSKLNSDVIIENTYNLDKLYKLSESNKENKLKINDKIETYGSISRGVTIGNNQNSVLNSELDLQISGKLNENTFIKASIQDSNIPIQNNGYSQQIDEFDQIFIEISSKDWKIRGGDIDLNENETFFGKFNKRIQGLAVNTRLNNSTNFQVTGAIVKGKYKRTQIITQNGNQGPYKLVGQNGELYVLVVSGSESVFVNGKRIERGIDKDYVINYNAGEIIFNSTFPIMSDMRVQIEYQVSEKNFNSFFGFSKIELKKNRSKHNISIYNENDIKDQPLLQNISGNQIGILSNAGDNSELMSAPTGILVSFDENRIFYKKETINNIEIFVYSNNPEDELYDVKFTNVGQNQGNYILINDNTIENIYEYISPENGEKQGNYEPIIKLIAPKKLQLLTYNSIIKIKNNSQINIELSASNKDENLFSSIDDSNNTGFASKLNYITEKSLNDLNLITEFDINYIEDNFNSIERIYNTEFNRDWDLPENISRNYNQLFTKGILEISNKKVGVLNYIFESLKYGDFFNGIRNNININSNKNKILEISSSNSFMHSDQDDYSSDFINSNNYIKLNHKIGWAEINYNYEKKKSNIIQDLLNPDFGQDVFQIKKGFGNKEKSFVEIGYQKKNNDSIFNGDLNNVNSYRSYFINSEIINDKKTRFSIYINQNNSKSINENSSEEFLNTRLIYNQKLFKNHINSNLFFETNSGNLPQQEFTFIEVEPGLGTYKWIDINGNNIQELEEFEIAVFEDEGRYIRVLLPNQIFIRTYQNKLNYSLKVNFLKLRKSDLGFNKFLSKISNQFQYSLDKKTNLDINPNIELNPFSIDDYSLLAYNYSLKNVFYFNRSKQKYSLAFTFIENKSKNNFSFGSTKSSSLIKKINFIHKIDDLYLLEIIANNQKKTNWSESFQDKNYDINDYSINPKLTYFSGINNRINFIYKLSNIDNSIGNQESLKQQNFGVSLFLNQNEKTGFISQFNYFKNEFNGDINSVISYIMMNGLQKGENYTWSCKFQRKLSKLLDINFIYMGRKSNKVRTIHNGSIQLKAIF